MNRSHAALVFVLIVVNLLLYGSGLRLRNDSLGGNTSDPFISDLRVAKFTHINPPAMLRNSAYADPFFRMIEQHEAVLMLGTSESIRRHNVGAQMNTLAPNQPRMLVRAESGMSPIHLALRFAACKRDQIRIPPLVWLVNLVYFTESHDVVNDGWLNKVLSSDVFAEMNHENVMDHVDPDVRSTFDRHFAYRRWLKPIATQEYASNLWYLKFHQPATLDFDSKILTFPNYEYDSAKRPEYDEQRGVQPGYRAADALNKERWNVKKLEDSNSIRGLRSIVRVIEAGDAPFLLVILPTNRRFYEANGLDMQEYDRRYALIRDEIKSVAAGDSTSVIDMYDDPKLDQGFADRMHADAYGEYQMANYLLKSAEYAEFISRTRQYYADPSAE